MPPREQRHPTWPVTNRRDLAGQTFGRLVVISDSGERTGNGAVIWLCRCECGGVARVASHNLRGGNTSSCGCLQVERSREANKKK